MNTVRSSHRLSRRTSTHGYAHRTTRSRLKRRLRAPQGFRFLEQFRELLLAAAIAYALGGVPVLWNVIPQVSPFVFTATGSLTLVAVALFTRSWRLPDRRLLIAVAVYLGLYIVCTYLSYAINGAQTTERWSLLQTNTLVLVLGLFYFLAGGTLAGERRWGVIAGLVAAYAFITLYALANRDVLTSTEMIFRMRKEGDVVDYQPVGDAFALIALTLMARWQTRIRSLSWRGWVLALVFVAFSVVVLFIVPSRSAAFLGAACLMLALVMRARGWGRIGLAAALVVAGVVIAMQPVEQLADGSRFEALVEADQEDASVQGREEILEEGWKVIAEHPFIGQWAFELERMGRSGLYIHNALDIWAQAGIVPFVAFIVMWCLLLWRLIKTWRRSPRRMGATVPLVAFALLSWVVSRHASYVLPMLGLGFFAAQIVRLQARRRLMKARHRKLRRRSRERSASAPLIEPVVSKTPIG